MTLRALIAVLLAFTVAALNHPAQAQSNRAPLITGTPSVTVAARTLYHFLPTTQDPGNQKLTYSINWKPAWASFSTTTGRLTGTPGVSHVGRTPDMVISVTDGIATSSLAPFSIAITTGATPTPTNRPPTNPTPANPPPTSPAPANPPPASSRGNQPPVISGVPPTTAVARRLYHFKPEAHDPEGAKLTYSISHKPAWAAFSTTTGRLTGAPGSSHVGTISGIVIRVSDGRLTSALPAFSITISARDDSPSANRPPTVAGTPSSEARAGMAYSFTPSGTDPDGDALTWSITGKPPAASFNLATGRLHWTPTATGTFRNIVITATDRHGASASLRAFTIAVTAEPTTTSSAALSWQAPMRYTDGSSLPASRLAGFRIYRGSSASSLTRIAEVDGRTTGFTVQQLPRGTHYFAVTAVTTDGVESAYSAIGSKTIPRLGE